MKEKVLTSALVFMFAVGFLLSPSGIIAKDKEFVEPGADHNAPKYSDERLDAILKGKLKYPKEVIKEMQRPEKIKMVKDNARFSTYKKEYYKVDEDGKMELVGKRTFNKKGRVKEDFTTQNSTIPDSDMILTVASSELSPNPETKKNRFVIYSAAVWKKDTFFNWEDKHAIAYDDTFVPDALTNGDFACAHWVHLGIKDGEWVFPEPSNNDPDCGGAPGQIDQYGASWNIDIEAHKADASYVGMKIETKNPPDGKKHDGRIRAAYAHDESLSGGGIGVSFGPVSINFSGGSVSERAVLNTFSYTAKK